MEAEYGAGHIFQSLHIEPDHCKQLLKLNNIKYEQLQVEILNL